MKLASLLTGLVLTGLVTVSTAPLNFASSQGSQAFAAEAKDATGLTAQQKIDMLIKHKGQFGSGDQLRRFFFGDLEPIAVQPGGAGMVVNLYNKANNVTIAYCATYDVVVAVKKGKVTKFAASEVK
ncbi:hypothetical protein BST81_18340 [Leptolyngbya sp. 'hensonii']|uniref:hypothetical protein n=1 Tax=Leptolyngbya sp. 'hensonii' TaxID=1922337 RepID=UPI00094FD109|nr:hypothetical protein [Leptolyngbya sp. 'hensonii']OLP16947.1 hypothetical protein BST81_18340 [Leptolyngbya sp. 'hensonii']